ncbi:MAG: hypothetical protein LUD19_06495 [Clostridia bacterium]|nr:hypothetical protein [Clostridia bacterium]
MEDEEQSVILDETDDTGSETAPEDTDSEFEYDEDGNIIIPDVIADDEQEEAAGQDDNSNDGDNTSKEETQPANNADSEEKAKQKAELEAVKKQKDTEIATLKKRLKAIESQGKETLSKLGVKADDVLDGLEKVAAESEEIPVEEYKKKKAEKERTDEAVKAYQRAAFEKKMQSDLEEVQKYYPETKGKKSVTEIDNFNEFAKLRDKGLSPKQAYAAANPDGIRTNVATSVRQQSLNETKAHLKSVAPKSSKDNSVSMTRKELSEWRDLFPGKSDKEIYSLYKQSLN